MVSPAERYAAARRRQATPHLVSFRAGYPFGLDPFQERACVALESGSGVLVAAPTGSGKTVVGEFAAHLALATGRKCFYTTPIKALSNQKYNDLVERHGAAAVGLLTGDTHLNGEAPVVVMTTEVLRNMLYAGSDTLRGLGYVVMDEVHYLADRFRGAVWEEVIIHLPPEVVLASLSATVSNAEELGEWLADVRGRTEIVVEEHRPVPLSQHVLVDHHLHDLFAGTALAPVGEPPGRAEPARSGTGSGSRAVQVNPALRRLADNERRVGLAVGPRDRPGGRPGPGRPRFGHRPPSRPDVIRTLEAAGLLPAITFIFSRAGCDAAVAQCIRAGLRLTTEGERDTIRAAVTEATAALPDADLRVLGYWEWLDGLERGLAAHHAGMLPTFKEVVEDLFTRGLVRAVFATETLALGINMPARSVVLEKLTKWNGDGHADITPGEYTQLTGRAGRRGIDVEGHAVVLWTAGLDPHALAGLASTRTYPLRSSFRPTYNMAVNLVGQVGAEEARRLLELSFAQFQADRAVVGLARQAERAEAAASREADGGDCERGDARRYAALRQAIKDRETALHRQTAAHRRAEVGASLEDLRIGDVVVLPGGRRGGAAVVVGLSATGPTVVTVERQLRRLTAADTGGALQAQGRIRLPRNFSPRSPQARRDLVSTLRAQGLAELTAPRPPRSRSVAADDTELAALRAELRASPVHACPDREQHVAVLSRAASLAADARALRQRVTERTHSVARTFDRVVAVLTDLGYLVDGAVTPAGDQLARIYTECDLLTAEAVRRGVWDDLAAGPLAAAVSTVVFESRRPEDAAVLPPAPTARAAIDATTRVWAEVSEIEGRHRLATQRHPDAGLAWAAQRWVEGASLDSVLTATDMSAGDFVRSVKQLIDVLGQLADLRGTPTAAVARQAASALQRGVITYA